MSLFLFSYFSAPIPLFFSDNRFIITLDVKICIFVPIFYDFLVKKGFEPKSGARSVKRAIREHLEDALCDMLLDNPERKGRVVFDMKDGKLEIQPDK